MNLSTNTPSVRPLFLSTLRQSLSDSPQFKLNWSFRLSPKEEKELIFKTVQLSWKSRFSSLLQEQWHQEFLKIKKELLARTTSLEFEVELQTVRNDQCRLFHTDKLGLRMICTYVGPGTQICRDSSANRQALGQGDNYKIVRDWKKIYEAREGEYCFLEGDLYPSRLGKGVIHRSPPVEKDQLTRLVLRIDEAR